MLNNLKLQMFIIKPNTYQGLYLRHLLSILNNLKDDGCIKWRLTISFWTLKAFQLRQRILSSQKVFRHWHIYPNNFIRLNSHSLAYKFWSEIQVHIINSKETWINFNWVIMSITNHRVPVNQHSLHHARWLICE